MGGGVRKSAESRRSVGGRGELRRNGHAAAGRGAAARLAAAVGGLSVQGREGNVHRISAGSSGNKEPEAMLLSNQFSLLRVVRIE